MTPHRTTHDTRSRDSPRNDLSVTIHPPDSLVNSNIALRYHDRALHATDMHDIKGLTYHEAEMVDDALEELNGIYNPYHSGIRRYFEAIASGL